MESEKHGIMLFEVSYDDYLESNESGIESPTKTKHEVYESLQHVYFVLGDPTGPLTMALNYQGADYPLKLEVGTIWLSGTTLQSSVVKSLGIGLNRAIKIKKLGTYEKLKKILSG